jgi:glutathione gamma-glutamylcysteinyltransferase
MFKEALESGTMETYFSLASNFVTQADPATCGLGTLSMVLNSLEMDPDRIWKGSWRWYSEDMLDCCRPMDIIKQEGITLDELGCTAICNGASVEVIRVNLTENSEEKDVDAAERAFRETVKTVSQTVDRKLVVSYDRGTLLQTGTGHFSPIGGYHEASDSVLILDVARFKYPPHWVPLKLLVKSMSKIDPSTSLSRGYMVLQRSSAHTGAVLRVNIGRSQWKQFADAYRATMTFRLKSGPSPSTLVEYLQKACKIITDTQVMEYLVQYVDSIGQLASEHQQYIQHVFDDMQNLAIMKALASFPEACCKAYAKPGYKEVATIFLLAQGPIGLEFLEPTVAASVSSAFQEHLPPEVYKEVTSLNAALKAIIYACCCREEHDSKCQPSTRSCASCSH